MKTKRVCERCGLKPATYFLLLCKSYLCDGCSFDLTTISRRELKI